MEQHTVLVTDGDERAALATVRSLGKDHTVYVCSNRPRSLASVSRYCRGTAAVSDPLVNPDRFINEIRNLISLWKVDTIIPIADPSLLVILDNRALLPPVTIPFPPPNIVRKISDKAALCTVAESYGIDVPSQQIVHSRKELLGLDTYSVKYPLVIKPSRSVREHNGRSHKLSVSIVLNREQLVSYRESATDEMFPLLLQQHITGPGVAVSALLWNDNPVALFAHRRIREKPPSGGVSVYRESVAPSRDLANKSLALLRHFGWKGVAMVEYKIDSATGTPYLMEINGRLWGSLQLAIDSGVDFPALLLAAAKQKTVAPVLSYKIGVRSRWWWGDVDHLLTRLTMSSHSAKLVAATSTRLAALREFFKTGNREDHNEVLRKDDPRPFVYETGRWFREVVKQ